jgi:hypothetical protein
LSDLERAVATDFLDLLRERLSAMLAERSGLDEKFEAILASAAAEQRADLNDAEKAEYEALVAEAKRLDDKVAETRQRVDEIEANRKSSADAADAVKRFNINIPKPANGDVRGSDHTLDELFWASVDSVRPTSADGTPDIRANVRHRVNPVQVRNANGETVLNPKIDEFPENRRQAIRAFQQTVADMQTFGLLAHRNKSISGQEAFLFAREHPAFADKYKRVLRAMDTDTSAEGIEWIPTGVGATLNERVRAAGKVAPLFDSINLPTNPWKWPLEGADATAYRVAEPTSDTATKVTVSTPGTGAATFDAEIFGARVLFSRSLEADSAIAILPYVQRKIVQAFVDAEEKAILDGDTDGTHQDSDVGASTTDARTAWDGLRKRGLANSSVSAGGAITPALLAARRADMDQYGINPSDLAIIVGMGAYYTLVTDTAVVSVDKYGPMATVHTGELGSLYGIPIIVSEWVRSDLNASGVYDGITTTKTYALVVNRKQWVMGHRTPLSLETDDSIYRETYQRVVVGWMREDFQNVNARGANEDDTSYLFNVT